MKLQNFAVLIKNLPEKRRPRLEKAELAHPPQCVASRPLWTGRWLRGQPRALDPQLHLLPPCCPFTVTNTSTTSPSNALKALLIDYLKLNRPEGLGERDLRNTAFHCQGWASASVSLPVPTGPRLSCSRLSGPSGKGTGGMPQQTRSSRNLNLQGKNVRMENNSCNSS